MAKILGKEGLSWLTNLTEVIRKKINDTYFDPETNQYDQGTQSANAMAVAYGLADPERIPAIVRNIAEDVKAHGDHLTTGSVGTKAVIQSLCEYGYEDTACRIMQQTSSPGFGYMIENGATTIWERWEADNNNNIMNSRNHPMMVQAAVWFYKYLGGIRSGCGRDGVQTLTVFPLLPQGLSRVKTEMELLAGQASCSWEKRAGETEIRICIPQNQEADAVLLKKYGNISVSECESEPQRSISSEEQEDRWIFRLLPGSYRFLLA